MFLEKREDFFPAVLGLFNTVHRPVVIEEPMTGAIVAVKFVILFVLFEDGVAFHLAVALAFPFELTCRFVFFEPSRVTLFGN